MLQHMKLAGVIAVSAGIASFVAVLPASAQVVDGTGGKVSRCDMHRSLGRVLPPECGGTGKPGGDTTRGRVVIGTPDQGTKPAAGAPAAPAGGTTAATPPAATAPAGTAPAATAAPTVPAPSPTAPKGLGILVPFALDSDVLTADAKRTVDQLAEVFKLNPGDKFVIEGHTDTSGGEVYNKGLSERRAQSVINYLVSEHKLPRERFEGRGLGSAKLLLPNDPTNGRNRRVQILNVGS